MKASTLIVFFALSSIHLLGYNLIPDDQVRDDGHRLLNPKHIAELEQILSELNEGNTTASGKPIAIEFHEALIPFGPPRWEKPYKVKRLCDQYYKKNGDTPNYRRLKVDYLLMVAYRANRLGLDGQTKLEDRNAFKEPYVEEADELLEGVPLDERDSLWYLQKARVIGFKDIDLAEWISSVRKIYPKHPDLLITFIYEQNLDIPAIEAEISERSLSSESSDILYARVITTLLENHFRNQEPFLKLVDWERHMDGLQRIHELYPTDYNYDVYRYFACFLEDKELACKLFDDGPERPSTYLWTSSEFPFEDWKAWATGKNTFPKLEQDQTLFGVWKKVDSFGAYPRKSIEDHQRRPTYYIYDKKHQLQIIGKYAGGMNHKTRGWTIEGSGHVRITKIANQQSWSQTMFSDGKALVVQQLGAPYGTSYFEYIGTVEDALPEISEAYYKLNPNKN